LFVVMTLAMLGVVFHEHILGSVAYALEKGRLEAGQEHLAKVEAISTAFRTVARQVQPAVVHITTTARSGAEEEGDEESPHGNIDPEELPEPFREFFKKWEGERGFRFEMPAPRPREASGSGVIIDADQGLILTNYHVVQEVAEGTGRIDVYLQDGRRVKAEIVGTDPKTDLGLVRVEADRLHAIPVGDSDAMEVGDWVLAIGAPFGLEQTVTQGIVSAKGRHNILPRGQVGYQDLIQTDAAINPGNSGGPLVNMRGELIGINTAIATNSLMRGYMGIGFAIPSKTVNEILPDLRAGREVVRGYLGVSIRSLEDFPPGVGEAYGLEEDRGVLIEDVRPGTPAAKAGLKMDDIVLEYDGKKIETSEQLQFLVAHTRPDTKVDMVVWRDKERVTVPVTIEKQPADFFAWTGEEGAVPPGEAGGEEAPVEIESLGMTTQKVTEELAGKFGWDYEEVKGMLVVTEVKPLGEARALGIRPGNLIVSVQRERITSGAQLKKALSEEALADGVLIKVRTRAGYRTFYEELAR
jgi:serine protease Do